MLVDYPNYYPDEINKQEDGILSRCSRGYIFQTSSDYCLFVENMRGGTPLFFYREDYDNELKMSTDNIDYIKIIFDDHNDTVLHITDDKNIRDLCVLKLSLHCLKFGLKNKFQLLLFS